MSDDLELTPEQIEQIRKDEAKKLKLRQLRSEASWRAMLKSPEGRRVIWELLEVCDPINKGMVAGHPDLSGLNEGMRQVGNYILGQIGFRVYQDLIDEDEHDEYK